MKGNFLKVRQFLEDTYPELKGQVTAGKYPTPPIAELMNNLLMMLQLGAVAWIVFGGDSLLRMVGFQEPPKFYYMIQENGFQLAIAIFLLLPQMVNTFAISGSFEVYLNNGLIFSKLSEGRMPDARDLTAALDHAGLTRR